MTLVAVEKRKTKTKHPGSNPVAKKLFKSDQITINGSYPELVVPFDVKWIKQVYELFCSTLRISLGTVVL